MGPSEHALHTLAEAAATDPELALELAVCPRAALGRLKSVLLPEDCQALARIATAPDGLSTLLAGNRPPAQSEVRYDLPALTAMKDAPGVGGKPHLAFADSEPDAGAFTFELKTQGVPYFTQNLLLGPNYSFRRKDQSDLKAFGFVGAREPIGASLSASPSLYRRPAEVQLYAHDPEELAEYLSTLPQDFVEISSRLDAQWPAQYQPIDSVVI